MSLGNRVYWLLVHAVAIAGGIYGAVRLFSWTS
jgi:hypothetical protein